MVKEELEKIQRLLNDRNFNEDKYINDRLQRTITIYANEIIEKNPNFKKYHFNDEDINIIIDKFINGKTKNKDTSLLLKYRFDNDEKKEIIKSKITAIVADKTTFRKLWHENYNDLKKGLLNVFKNKKDVGLNRLELAQLFITENKVSIINQRNDNFISNQLTLNDWEAPQTPADFNLKSLISSIRKDFRNQESSDGYIIVIDPKMLDHQTKNNDEKTEPTIWKYTENWKQIKIFCAASAIHGGKRTLANLLFLSKNNQIDNITSQITDVANVIEKLEKEKESR